MLSTGYTTKGIIDPSVTIPFFTNLKDYLEVVLG